MVNCARGIRATARLGAGSAHIPDTKKRTVDSGQERCLPSDPGGTDLENCAVTPRKESSVVKRLAIVWLAVGVLFVAAVPAVGAQRAVLAELFGADW